MVIKLGERACTSRSRRAPPGWAWRCWWIHGVVRVGRPPHPADGSQRQRPKIAKIYSAHGLRIRIGLALMTLFSVFFTPYLALLSRQVRRIEGYWGVMSLTQVMLSVTFPFGFMLCSISAMAAAYRPERNPDVTQALNDVFWFIFVGLVGPLIFQVVVLAIRRLHRQA